MIEFTLICTGISLFCGGYSMGIAIALWMKSRR